MPNITPMVQRVAHVGQKPHNCPEYIEYQRLPDTNNKTENG